MSVTIGIPAFNGEKFISEVVNSCYNQSIKPKEILVVDDSSTDKTGAIVESLASFYKNVRLITNGKNRGIGFTRRLIVDECKTDYLAFCSADDVLESNFIETMLNYAKVKDAFFYSDYKLIDGESKEIGLVASNDFEDYSAFAKAVIEAGQNDRMFICYNLFGPTPLWQKNNFDASRRFGEDLKHLLECVKKRVPFVHVPFPLFKYRVHGGSITSQRKNDIHANNLQTFKEVGIESFFNY